MKKGHKHSTGQLILKAIQLIKKKLQDAGPFQDELIEQKYHKHFLQSIVCTHNMGSIATLGISTVYHGGVLMVRQNSKGIHSFDDYMFVLRLSVLLALWVLFSMSSRLSESRKIRVAVFVRRSIHVRFFLFMGELLFMDMHIERAQMMSMILTLAFSVTLNSYKEHIGFNGALAYAGHFARIVIHKHPQSFATEIESIFFSTALYVFCLFLFTVFQVRSRTQFLRNYARQLSQSTARKDAS